MTTDIRERMELLVREMSKGAFEREEAIGLSLLSALSGESIFLLGLPGVGKSMIARRLKSAFKDSTCFEYLMSRFSTPDEIFGPVSISKLKDGDTYERCVDGYLPTADVIFLDEIWKAGPAIQNSLLTALNEKIFHNGKVDLDLPLKGIIAASNELPAEDEGLEALWDRFLIRYIVKPISHKNAFMRLIGNDKMDFRMPANLPLSPDEYAEIQKGLARVIVPEAVMESLFELRELYAKRFANKEEDEEEEAPYISDRRWKKIVGILRASAYLNGRNVVDFSDCLLLEHMLWDKDTQLSKVMKDVAEMVATGVVRQLRKSKANGPVSEQLATSDDGEHYIVNTGQGELLIGVDDYKGLADGDPAYGRFASGNKMIVDPVSGDFRLKCEKFGTLNVNTFTYQLQRKRGRKSVSIEDVMDTPAVIEEMVSRNIFLRETMEDYPYLTAVANRFKGFRK